MKGFERKMEQFFTVSFNDLKEFQNRGMSITDLVVYSLLCDRMKSSQKRIEFYDNRKQAPYVIYTVRELEQFLQISHTTVNNAFKKLDANGYIEKVTFFQKATRIFLPKFNSENVVTETSNDDQKQESGTTESKNVESNHTDFNHTDFTSDTNNTVPSEFKDIEHAQLKDALTNVGGFSKDCASILFALNNGDVDSVRDVVGTIYKAKNTVLNANKGYKGIDYILTLESEYNSTLSYNLTQIMLKANKAKNKLGYIYTSFKQHFENVVFRAKFDKSEMTDIPMFKIG